MHSTYLWYFLVHQFIIGFFLPFLPDSRMHFYMLYFLEDHMKLKCLLHFRCQHEGGVLRSMSSMECFWDFLSIIKWHQWLAMFSGIHFPWLCVPFRILFCHLVRGCHSESSLKVQLINLKQDFSLEISSLRFESLKMI